MQPIQNTLVVEKLYSAYSKGYKVQFHLFIIIFESIHFYSKIMEHFDKTQKKDWLRKKIVNFIKDLNEYETLDEKISLFDSFLDELINQRDFYDLDEPEESFEIGGWHYELSRDIEQFQDNKHQLFYERMIEDFECEITEIEDKGDITCIQQIDLNLKIVLRYLDELNKDDIKKNNLSDEQRSILKNNFLEKKKILLEQKNIELTQAQTMDLESSFRKKEKGNSINSKKIEWVGTKKQLIKLLELLKKKDLIVYDDLDRLITDNFYLRNEPIGNDVSIFEGTKDDNKKLQWLGTQYKILRLFDLLCPTNENDYRKWKTGKLNDQKYNIIDDDEMRSLYYKESGITQFVISKTINVLIQDNCFYKKKNKPFTSLAFNRIDMNRASDVNLAIIGDIIDEIKKA